MSDTYRRSTALSRENTSAYSKSKTAGALFAAAVRAIVDSPLTTVITAGMSEDYYVTRAITRFSESLKETPSPSIPSASTPSTSQSTTSEKSNQQSQLTPNGCMRILPVKTTSPSRSEDV